MKLSYKHIAPLIHTEKSVSKWIGYIGLGVGVFLLLLSLQMYFNIQQLIREEVPQKSGGYDYVSISKVITNENMGRDNRFTDKDLELLKNRPEIQSVAPLFSNNFSARASAGDVLPFSTELFLESIENDFLDTIPSTFEWKPGDQIVPLIFSSDFLEMYNVFAPSQGLPQLSARTISSVNIYLECSGRKGSSNFRATVVGLSDRFNSVLVPESFLKWANENLAGDSAGNVSRVYIKTVDANNPDLIRFLQEHQYHINKDKIRFGRMKGLLQNIIGAVGGFGILVVLLALILFSFYLRLMIAKSTENLRLLLTLGYSPGWLTKGFTRSFIPVYAIIILISIGLASLFQYFFSRLSFANELVSPILHIAVWITSLSFLLLTFYANNAIVRREIRKMD